jgi:hypothetical protein
MILFLDDSPERAAVAYQRMSKDEQDQTIWCRTVEETITTLWDYREVLKFVFLDHDLGGETYVNTKREDCGMEVVRYLENLSVKEPIEFNQFENIKFIIHSWNITAGAKMMERLKTIGLNVDFKPFGMR